MKVKNTPVELRLEAHLLKKRKTIEDIR